MSVEALADTAAVDPYFLSFAVAAFAAATDADLAAVAGRLGTTPAVLAHVRLCPSPRSDAAGFRDDIDRIAAKFSLDRDALAAIARHGQVVAAMRSAPDPDAAAAGLVVAARDRENP